MKKNILLFTGIFLFCTTFAQTYYHNVLDFGAKGDGKSNDVHAINAAIKKCVDNGGGTVFFPAGQYLTGSFQLFSNVHLYLDAGAVIKGSSILSDYFLQKDYLNNPAYFFNTPGAGNKMGIIFACGAENVSVSGNGTIFGNGNSFMYMDRLQTGSDEDKKYTRQKDDYLNPVYGEEDGPVMWKGNYEDKAGVVLIFYGCKNVSVKDIHITESPNWTFSFLNCAGVSVRGVSIENNMKIPNSDGINLYNVRNAVISDCDVQAGDDALIVSACQNVTANNCVLTSRSCGIRMGYGFTGDSTVCKGILFNNIRIYNSNRGIGIFQRTTGNYEDILFSNIVMDTRLHSGVWWGNGEPVHISALPGVGGKEVGEIKNIRFQNIIAYSEEGIVIYGYAAI